MTKYVPPSFNRAKVLDGLHKAMGFGEPNKVADKATFFFPKEVVTPDGPADDDGVPFDPDAEPVTSQKAKTTQPCAVEWLDLAGQGTRAGEISSGRIRLTILQPEWEKVFDFSWVVVGGEKYLRDEIQPPIALGSIDVWIVDCIAEEER